MIENKTYLFFQALEHSRRGTSDKFMLKGEKNKKPADWKAFLSNDSNKQQFIDMLVQQWSQDRYAPKIQGRKVIITADDHAYLLSSSDGKVTSKEEVSQLQSTKEETDSQ